MTSRVGEDCFEVDAIHLNSLHVRSYNYQELVKDDSNFAFSWEVTIAIGNPISKEVRF
jgi:hypothetical protein